MNNGQEKRDDYIAKIRDLARRLNELAADSSQRPDTRASLARAAAQLEAEADRLETS